MLLFQTLMVSALLVMGMGIALLGTIKVELARRLAIDEARVGGLISLFGFTIIPVVFGMGYVTDHLGKWPVLVAGCGLVVASLVVLAYARDYLTALAGALLLGAGWSALVNVGNVLTPLAFAKGPGETAFATNLANVFFGAGAFFTPLGLAPLLKRTGFTTAMLVVAGLAAVPGILALTVNVDDLATGAVAAQNAEAETTSSDSADSAPGPASATAGTVLTNPIIWLCGLAFFCYFPLEASMAGWTTTFLMGRGIGETSAARIFSGFWLAYLGARLLTALELPPQGELPLILVLSAASAIVLLALTLCRGPLMAAVVVLAAGLCFGPIFPTTMAVLLDNADRSALGRAVGLAIALGGLGSSTMPLLIGAGAGRTSLQRAFLIAVGLGVGLVVIALLLMTRLG